MIRKENWANYSPIFLTKYLRTIFQDLSPLMGCLKQQPQKNALKMGKKRGQKSRQERNTRCH
ncbi:MAG: hypothetical protein ACTSRI_20295 [Promethearchaeota archaeon]